MDVIILAGGRGTRLQSVVSNVPKPMAPVNKRPFLEILLDQLLKSNVSRFILSVGYMHDSIISHFGRSYGGVPILYSVEDSPLGTGGAIKSAINFSESNNLLVVNGDSYFDVNHDLIYSLHLKNQEPYIVLKEMPDISRYGSISISQNRIMSFIEKGKCGKGLINGGCYCIPRNFLEGKNGKLKFSFEDYLAAHVREGNVLRYVVSNGCFIDIGIPEDYEKAQKLLFK